MFRWQRTESGYKGVDGSHWYRIGHGVIQTNADELQFNRLFNLETIAGEITDRIVDAAPEMEPYLGSLHGLRILQPSDPAETFFSFLCTANNHLKRITPMVAKLAAYGDQIPGSSFRKFPDAARMAEITEAELRGQGFGYRGATIPFAAREVMRRGGDAWFSELKQLGYAEAHRQLVEIKGIGNKLADCICLYGLHYGEAVPIDTHMWQAACRVFFPEHRDKALTDQRYRQIGDFFRERFGELAGWAHLFLYYDNMLRGRRGDG